MTPPAVRVVPTLSLLRCVITKREFLELAGSAEEFPYPPDLPETDDVVDFDK